MNQHSGATARPGPPVRVDVDPSPDIRPRSHLWMSAALCISAVASWLVGSSPAVGARAAELALPLVIGVVVLVAAIDAVIARIRAGIALALLGVYAAAVGLTLSCLVIAGGRGSVETAFLSAAGMFGAAGVLCIASGRSLASAGGYLAMALIGIAVASFVNVVVFTRPVDELGISIIAVAAFVGLTAWNVRRIARAEDPDAAGWMQRDPLVAALALYLELVNVFLDLVRAADRIVGDTREDPAWHARHGLPTDRRVHPR